MLLWTTAFVVAILVALVVARAFGWDAWGKARWQLNRGYAAGVIVGVGVGLTICPFLIMRFGVEPIQLSFPGVVIGLVGALMHAAQTRAARDPFATR